MKTRCKSEFYLMSLLVLAVPLICSAADPGDTRREAVTRTFGDDLFAAGANVRVVDGSPGDAVAAGGDLDLAGRIAGDAVAAGGKVALKSDVGGDLYAAGGELSVEGAVAGNARLAGGSIELDSRSDIGGGLSVAGGEVRLNGRVGRYAVIAAGETMLDGRVDGDVEVSGGELQIGPNAVVEGTVTFRGPKPAVVADGAQVTGGVQHVEWQGGTGRPLRGFGVAMVLWTIGWIIVGAILFAMWPGFTGKVTTTLQRRPGMSLLVGTLVLICAPVAILVLLVTVLGIPLALVAVALYLLSLPLGYVAGAAALGEWTLQRIRAGRSIATRERIFALAGALLILLLLGYVPFVGSLLRVLVLLTGIGALMLAVVGSMRERTAA